MNIPPPAIQKHKIGTCPHGLPAGACPICNGMGGGGGAKKADPHAGEMSWDECYAVWQQMLKAQQLAQQKRNDALQAQVQVPLNFTNKLENVAIKIANLADKLADFIQKTQTQTGLQKIFSKPLVFVANLAIPVLNIIKNIPILAQKTISFISEKFADISDKLSAIFGELKNIIEKKILERLKNFRKKFKSLFGIFEPEVIEDEDKKIEEAEKLFEFKTVLNTIKEKFKKKDRIDMRKQEFQAEVNNAGS